MAAYGVRIICIIIISRALAPATPPLRQPKRVRSGAYVPRDYRNGVAAAAAAEIKLR
jgi:hypothetical protein